MASHFVEITDPHEALRLRRVGLAWFDGGLGKRLPRAAPEATLEQIHSWMLDKFTYYVLVEDEE